MTQAHTLIFPGLHIEPNNVERFYDTLGQLKYLGHSCSKELIPAYG